MHFYQCCSNRDGGLGNIDRNASSPATHLDTSGQLHRCWNIQQEHLKKRSKAMDMRFHWIQDIILKEHFHNIWKPKPTNLEDYHSKHHPTPHQIQVQHTNLHETHSSQNTLQVCVNTTNRYTTGTSLGLSKGLNTNHIHRDNNQFANKFWQSR